MKQTKKVIINTKIGGFDIRTKGLIEYLKLRENCNEIYCYKYTNSSNDIVPANFISDISDIGEFDKLIFSKVFYGEHIDDIDSYEFLDVSIYDIQRDDPNLIEVAETIGNEINTDYSILKIVEIPADVEFYISENDMGIEYIHEKHKVWSYKDKSK